MLTPLSSPSHGAEKCLFTPARRQVLHLAVPALLLWGALGCGPVDETETSDPDGFSQHSDQQQADNGLSLNGLSLNGLSLNGLSLNGLSLNGLSTATFKTWFQENRTLNSTVMRYLVHCALPFGQSLSFTEAGTGQRYTWSGGLGVAPDWASGRAATVTEQQVVSACLAAHVNKYGLHVPLSVLGRTAKGHLIPVTLEELTIFSRREACFFGNLFTGEGVHVGNDRGSLSSRQSSARVCTLSSSTDEERVTGCAPLTYVGACTSHCTLDPTRTFYTSCRYNGVTYRPLTTRLREVDIYSCGDGTCQMTESCGNSNKADSCKADCGTCP